MKRLLVVCVLTSLAACTTDHKRNWADEEAVKLHNNNDVQAAQHCSHVRMSCDDTSYYREWRTSTGEVQCTCKPWFRDKRTKDSLKSDNI